MLEQPNIPEEHLRACLREQYALAVATLEFLPLGADNRSGVYRMESEQGTSYLLKARSGSFYEPSCLVPHYLSEQGIAAVVAPLPTKSGGLWTRLGEWTLIVYPFIEGHTRWNPGLTDAQWQAVGTALRQIHQARLPAEGFPALRTEAFDPAEYRRMVHALETEHISAEGGSQMEQTLRAAWRTYQQTIHTGLASLERLAAVLQRQAGPFVICHADLHPGNIIRPQASNEVFVIDWDDVMLAPRERDFLFVGETRGDGSVQQDTTAFFQGYGQAEIDWIALTYYLWERAIQDLLYDAEAVFLRDDVGEANKAAALKTFHAVFVGASNEVDKALAAAAHLPADLRIPTRRHLYEY
ncbi:MAG TPA: aminoglycoside phosphotransferase family protein [Ktedonobacterales bacterium]|nr:aminoglycoside phosphotransferase family protein [Ktedonobacterales bacterium]